MRQLTSHDFFVAADGVLAEHGHAGVTSVSLCARLGVTRGSFYHHFKNLDEFKSGYLAYRLELAGDIMSSMEDRDEFDQRSEFAIETVMRADFPWQRQIRAWASSDSDVAEMLAASQRETARGIQRSIERAGLGQRDASIFAEIIMSVLDGLFSRAEEPDRALVGDMFRMLETVVLVRVAAPSDQNVIV
jgi:AcrR family transcriptional regulator